MIQSLLLKNVATYDGSGIHIKDLRKINFLYGVNGSGKTTLTKFIADPASMQFKDCSFKWKSDLQLKTLVYNKDFRDRNFGQGKMDGVFTLGEATKEQTELIETKLAEKKELKERWTKKKETLDKQKKLKVDREAEFKEEVWAEIYKKHEREFKDCFSGYMTKENFKNKILQEYGANKSALVNYDILQEKSKTIFGKPPVPLIPITILTVSRLDEIENDGIWKKKVVGKADVDIAKLIQRLNINDWVNQGKQFLKDNYSICPFCQQPTITENFKYQLENYFDESFINDTTKIKQLKNEYLLLASNLSSLLEQIETSEKANSESKLDKEPFFAYLQTLNSFLISNRELLNNKEKEPSRSLALTSISQQIDKISGLIASANLEIEKHNQIVANYSKEKLRLIQAIWRFLIEEHKIIIQNFISNRDAYQKAINGIEESIKETAIKYNALSVEIKVLSKSVTSVQPSIDEMNTTLRAYGFRSFSIVPSNLEANKYQIQREDGTIAESTMSEGEVTFITFLYFLQLCKGSTSENTIVDERILVIDDPICSLDSNVLFVVSSLIKEIIKNIKRGEGNVKQLILLTHNVYFHKEVSFVDGRKNDCKDTAFWMLRKNGQITSIQNFNNRNPIQSSYELLWAELKNRQHSSGLTIQNTMRRIIEHYYRILGKFGDDELINQFTNKEEQDICRSLLCWINDGSHTIPDDLFIESQVDTIERYFEVFEKIFEHTKHKEHFNMMMNASVA